MIVLSKKSVQRLVKNTFGTRVYYTARDIYNKYRFLFKDLYKRRVIRYELSRKGNVDISGDMEFLEFLHEQYPPHPKIPPSRAWLKLYAKSFLDEAKQSGVELRGKKILDVACGFGELLLVAKEYGISSVTGIDPDWKGKRGYEELCRQEGLKGSEIPEYVVADFLDYEPDGDLYDVVVSFAAFEHFSDPKAILDKCAAMLKPDGYLFTSFDPLFYSPHGAHRSLTTGIPYHQVIFNDDLVYDFFRDKRQDHAIHPNFETLLNTNDPYPEMNRWKPSQFHDLFHSSKSFDVLSYRVRRLYEYEYFIDLFPEAFRRLSKDDFSISGITAVLKKTSR